MFEKIYTNIKNFIVRFKNKKNTLIYYSKYKNKDIKNKK